MGTRKAVRQVMNACWTRGESGLVEMIHNFGVPKHSDLEPHCWLAEGSEYSASACPLNADLSDSDKQAGREYQPVVYSNPAYRAAPCILQSESNMRRLPLGVCMQLNQADLPASKAFRELDYVVIKTGLSSMVLV